MQIRLKRAYVEPEDSDGFRVLVDRIWPRGISKEQLRIDLWLKEIAPSNDLRKWFEHDPEKWDEFKLRYFSELENHKELVEELRVGCGTSWVTLIFSASDEKHNNAVALKEYLEKIGNPGRKKSESAD